MHEMSVASAMLDIIRDEMVKHEVRRLFLVKVRHGVLSNIVPEALSFAFEALTAGTDLEGAQMELESVPLKVCCGQCGNEFSPPGREYFYVPCPSCGNLTGHRILSGRELYIEHIQAE